MNFIFNKMFIMENPILFYIVSFLLLIMIILAIVFAVKEIKKDVN